MKCVKLNDSANIVRVTDNMAELMVKTGKGVYVPKSLWKQQVRQPAK